MIRKKNLSNYFNDKNEIMVDINGMGRILGISAKFLVEELVTFEYGDMTTAGFRFKDKYFKNEQVAHLVARHNTKTYLRTLVTIPWLKQLSKDLDLPFLDEYMPVKYKKA